MITCVMIHKMSLKRRHEPKTYVRTAKVMAIDESKDPCNLGSYKTAYWCLRRTKPEIFQVLLGFKQ